MISDRMDPAILAIVGRAELAELLDDELRDLAQHLPAGLWERVLVGPARGVLARPGKQFRATLVRSAWRLAGGGAEGPPSALTAAIEILHAGSLVIDDIEDDAEERRGAAALHRSHGVPVALNTGNWMYFFALGLIDRAPLPEPMRVAIHRVMLRAILECHRGQALDVGHDVTAIPRRELRAVVHCATAMKAGALTRLATELGAIAAGADDARCAAIATFGSELGIALQMLDDLGAVTSARRVDKLREDLWQLRPTWGWVWASEAADDASFMRCVRWARQVAQTKQDPLPVAKLLGSFGALCGGREARQRLAAARAAIVDLAQGDVLESIERELTRVEVSYD